MYINFLKEYQVKKVKKLEKLQLEEWQRLWDETDDVHFFNSPTYFMSFLETASLEEYIVFFCYRKKELVAVLPLVWGRKFAVKVLMCADNFGGSIDRSSLCLKVGDPRILETIIKSVTEEENLFLAEIEARHLNLFMSGDKSIIKNCSFEFSCKSPRLVLGRDLFENMSKKTKKKFKKKLTKSEPLVEFEFHRKSETADFEKMIAIEDKSWKGKKKISLFGREITRKVYASWIKNNNENVGIAFLKKDDQEIAYLFGIFSKETFLITNSAFVSEFGKITPGNILVFHTLRHLQSLGIRLVDFSVGDSRWKREFGNQLLKQYNFYFSKSKAVCLLWRVLLFCKRTVKRALKSKC